MTFLQAVAPPFEYPISVSIPSVEIKTGIISTYADYLIYITDFGVKSEVTRRFEDFIKLSEQLTGFGCPPLPAKTFFGSNEPKTVEDRRPALEAFVQFCVTSEAVLSEPNCAIWRFLDLSTSSYLVTRAILPNPPQDVFRRLVTCDKKPDGKFRDRRLVAVLIDELDAAVGRPEESEQQGTASPGPLHPCLINILELAFSKPIGRKTLSALKPLFKGAEKFPGAAKLLTTVYSSPEWHILFSSLPDASDAVLFGSFHESLHELTARLLWNAARCSSDCSPIKFCVSPECSGCSCNVCVAACTALGRLFVSPSFPARIIAASILAIADLPEAKKGRVGNSLGALLSEVAEEDERIDGASEVSGFSSRPSSADHQTPRASRWSFLPSVFRGQNGLLKVACALKNPNLEISAFTAYILSRSGIPGSALRGSVFESLEDLHQRLHALRNSGNDELLLLALRTTTHMLLNYRAEGCLPAPRVSAATIEATLRFETRLVAQDEDAILKAKLGRSAAGFTALVQQFTKMQAIDLKPILEVFNLALASRDVAVAAVAADLSRAKSLIECAAKSEEMDQLLDFNPSELSEWASHAAAVAEMEKQVLALEEQAVEAQGIILESEAESGLLETAVGEHRKTLLSLMQEGLNAERKKVEEKAHNSERALAKVREQVAAAEGQLSLARKQQIDVRSKGEAATSRLAVLEISLRQKMGDCYSDWSSKLKGVSERNRKELGAAEVLRGIQGKLINAESEKRVELLKACKTLRESLAVLEQQLT